MKRFLAGVLASMLCSSVVSAESAREILDEARARNDARNPETLAATVRMKQTRSDGVVSFERELRNYAKRYQDGTSRMLLVFHYPTDVKGIRFLSWSRPKQPDLQWLYLPTQGRVRQLAPATRRSSFRGSIFTYEDMELFEKLLVWTEEEAGSRLLSDTDDVGGLPCVKIELVPKVPDVSYARILVWLHRPDATLRKVQFENELGPSKTISLEHFRMVSGVPMPHRLILESALSGDRAILDTLDLEVGKALDEHMFSPFNLERAS